MLYIKLIKVTKEMDNSRYEQDRLYWQLERNKLRILLHDAIKHSKITYSSRAVWSPEDFLTTYGTTHMRLV